MKEIKCGNVIFGGQSFVLIAGPCVIESREMALSHAEALKNITYELGIPFVFKASYDKANRTSIDSFRGLGIEEGLDILQEIKDTLDVPVLSDVHGVEEVQKAAEVLDILQIPAFLCRQTDLLISAGKTNKIINIKKGQFLSPNDMEPVVEKVRTTGNDNILLTERGTTFGYNNLVSDFRSLAIMREWGYPIVFDATHSVQQPGGLGKSSGGESEYVPLLAYCAISAGCDSIFMETHENPKKALSDGANMLPLSQMKTVLAKLQKLDSVMRGVNLY